MKNGASSTRKHRWRRDTVELAAVFTAVAVADLVADVVGHSHDGPAVLIVSALALAATALWHTWWTHRHTHAPPGPEPGDIGSSTDTSGSAARFGSAVPAVPAVPAASAPQGDAAEPGSGTEPLWRIRVTVADTPGSLAALCRALAELSVNIVSMQAHPLAAGTVDEFLVRAPRHLAADALARALVAAGGTEVWLERADAHDLVDVPTRILSLATRTALDGAELPLALRQLFGRCTIRTLPAVAVAATAGSPAPPHEDSCDGGSMRLRDPSGGVLELTRDQPPFTPTEFARARALVALDSRLGPRVPGHRSVLRLPAGAQITVRRAEPGDRAAAVAMHERCGTETLRRRYHGPVSDADRYLGHLLEPRYGQTLAVEGEHGELVALGHLLWDDDAAEIAVLVEDAWQRRGIGARLVRRLAEQAVAAGIGEVYAVTTASNTGMVATLRQLGVPLDYQVEDGTLTVTAHLSAGLPAPENHTENHIGNPIGTCADGSAGELRGDEAGQQPRR